MRASAVPIAAAVLFALVIGPARAAEGGGVGSNVVFVPWRVLKTGDAPPPGVLVLYWIPLSRDDFRRSELLTYKPLTAYPPQCVSMLVVQAGDADTIARLGAADKLPVAVLGEGAKVLGTVENDRGALRAPDVDKLLRDTIESREEELNRDLDDAPKKLTTGDRDAAVALYRHVWEQRCLFPRHAREAERALKKLGAANEQ